MRVVPSFACILLDLFAGLFRSLQYEFPRGLLDSAAIGFFCILLVSMSWSRAAPAQPFAPSESCHRHSIPIFHCCALSDLDCRGLACSWSRSMRRWISFALSLAVPAALVWKARASFGPFVAWIGRLAANLSTLQQCVGCESDGGFQLPRARPRCICPARVLAGVRVGCMLCDCARQMQWR